MSFKKKKTYTELTSHQVFIEQRARITFLFSEKTHTFLGMTEGDIITIGLTAIINKHR